MSQGKQSNKGGRSSNDQRSDVKNPNNSDHKQNADNRSRNMDPNDSKYTGGGRS